MSLQSEIKRYPNVAIFARNHANLLDEAVAISTADPSRKITFRSKTVWRSAEIAISTHGPRPIYFLPIGGFFVIRYVATLERVYLHPKNPAEVREFLGNSVPSAVARHEELWPDDDGKPTVKTRYIVSNCHELEQSKRFQFTRLRRVDGGEYLDVDFPRGYAIVHGLSGF